PKQYIGSFLEQLWVRLQSWQWWLLEYGAGRHARFDWHRSCRGQRLRWRRWCCVRIWHIAWDVRIARIVARGIKRLSIRTISWWRRCISRGVRNGVSVSWRQ